MTQKGARASIVARIKKRETAAPGSVEPKLKCLYFRKNTNYDDIQPDGSRIECEISGLLSPVWWIDIWTRARLNRNGRTESRQYHSAGCRRRLGQGCVHQCADTNIQRPSVNGRPACSWPVGNRSLTRIPRVPDSITGRQLSSAKQTVVECRMFPGSSVGSVFCSRSCGLSVTEWPTHEGLSDSGNSAASGWQ